MNLPKIAQPWPILQDVQPGTYWWWACGLSAKQPFCDGAHKGPGLEPVKVEIPEARTVAWCGCKHSAKKPYCDGSHAKLA